MKTSDPEDFAIRIGKLHWMREFPKEEKHMMSYCQQLVKFVDPANLEWLVDEVAGGFVIFPAIVQMREVYQNRFRPLDGKKTSDFVGQRMQTRYE